MTDASHVLERVQRDIQQEVNALEDIILVTDTNSSEPYMSILLRENATLEEIRAIRRRLNRNHLHAQPLGDDTQPDGFRVEVDTRSLGERIRDKFVSR